ncbi:hypothetical protein SODALDRAFT_217165 [Sodiomyces alkalinus F11]|uniref:Uncharacterized protein n=1 Tax=Sodiomyces alkalinus (strain CBS 110278 / VKM F-3762 / F11) TaxID=1314773 RepID=A0A3N2PP84_SODAK|nr:hypothetical protein SODALDRAFT_217165 [Sodiomyces alkalinus F11]ROT36313.1 hypothetical protein SODALDRAFT_217165 [Sodiomyces alkalinus F11]
MDNTGEAEKADAPSSLKRIPKPIKKKKSFLQAVTQNWFDVRGRGKSPELNPIPRLGLQNVPPWDRVIDVVYHQHRRGQVGGPDNDDLFQLCLPSFLARFQRGEETYPRIGYMGLPDRVRFLVCKHLVAIHASENTKPICLTSRPTWVDVWESENFSSLQDLLRALNPFMRVSFGCFADTMLAILMTQRFHIIYTPFVNHYFNPLVFPWYRKYGRYMRNMVLEIDLTRLGFGPSRQALKLISGTVNIDVLLRMFVEVQLDRPAGTISSLVILCRRFYGCRPQSQLCETKNKAEPETELKVPYCPDSALRVCDPIMQLRGLVESIRICGFSEAYTKTLIQGLFTLPEDRDMLKHHTYRIAPSTLWPRIPGQSSLIDCSQGQIALDDHNRPVPEDWDDWSQGAVLPPAPYVTTTGETFVARPRASASTSSSETRKGSPRCSTTTMVRQSTRKTSTTTSAENRDNVKSRLGALKEKFTRKRLAKGKKTATGHTTWLEKEEEPCTKTKVSVWDSSDAESHTTFGGNEKTSRHTFGRDQSRPNLEAEEPAETKAKRETGLKPKRSRTELTEKKPKVALRNVASMKELRRGESKADLRRKQSRLELGQRQPRFTLRGIVSRLDLRSSTRRKSDEVRGDGK